MSGRDRQASRGQGQGGRDRSQRPPPQAQAAQQQRAADNRARQQRAAAGSETDQQAKPSGMKLSEPVVKAAAADGARNLAVGMQEASGEPPQNGLYQFPVLIVTSLAGHRIEAEVQQGSFNDAYSGTGQVQTAIIPSGPHGMEGRLRARDLDTGEEIEVTWDWVWFGGMLLQWLVSLVKMLFRRPGR